MTPIIVTPGILQIPPSLLDNRWRHGIVELKGDTMVELEIVKTGVEKSHRLCLVYLTRMQALQLVRSLTNQLISNDPNTGRLESPCRGSADELTIFVKPTKKGEA